MSEREFYTPYVVSADVEGLVRRWSQQAGYSLPENGYFKGMLKDLETTLSQYFSEVEVVPEGYLKSGLQYLADNAPASVISLDRAYLTGQERCLAGFLDITRSVNNQLEGTGLSSRRCDVAVDRQIVQLSAAQKGKSICLLDDVIFEGKTMLEIVKSFRKQGVQVENILAGIAIKDGVQLLEQQGVRVTPLLVYDQVIDEICERDFVVGCPLSGRSVVENGQVYGAPYLYPFGKPIDWASIPAEKAADFSLFCLTQSLDMWKKAERASQASIPTAALAKPVYGLPQSNSVTQSLELVCKTQKGGC